MAALVQRYRMVDGHVVTYRVIDDGYGWRVTVEVNGVETHRSRGLDLNQALDFFMDILVKAPGVPIAKPSG